MVEQATPNTTAQPAAPLTPPPTTSSAPAISPDTLVEVKVDGRPYQEPLSKVVASYQMLSAAEKRFQEANRILATHKGDIELAQKMRTRIDTDPEGAILELQQFAQQRLGRPIKLPGSHADVGEPGDQTGGEAMRIADARREAQIRELRDELAGFKAAQTVESQSRDIDAEVNRYPMWRNDSEQGRAARELAVLTIAAMKASQRDASISDIASEVHSRMQALASQQATQARDTRQQRMETMPVAPTQGGTPEMTSAKPDGWGKREALRNGTWAAELGKFMNQLGRQR